MKSVSIVGVGLIGASFGLALREAGFAGDIVGVSSPDALAAGLKRGAITRAASLEEAARGTDLIYLAQPVDRILASIEKLGPIARRDLLITDAGSTKQAIVEAAAMHLAHAQFLGGHPMAGKEARGAQSAEGSLFRGRPYVLTPLSSESETVREFKVWLARIGAHVIEMEAGEHDRTVALTSHLPQLLSTALAITLARSDSAFVAQIFGPALLDMTRLALSSSQLWAPILRTNRTFVSQAVEVFQKVLSDLQAADENDSLVTLIELGFLRASALRREKPSPASAATLQEFRP